MDWASAEWKQALTPLAVQKVRALEEKIEKLQKERQQKQLQLECQELALEKEKRKIEKEKQHSSELQKELQSLADICKDFENKQQKLQNELQSRDSRIKNLEALLSQSRKENSKLQQLESDLKDLSYVRENAISVREQKLQKKMHLFEQNITQEQISNTSMTEDSSINGHDDKEHVSNNLIDDNSEIEKALKKKIEEQEELIKELKTKLSLVSRNDEVHNSSNVFKTSSKAKSMSVTDSPVIHGKKVLNAWDVFSSTPAKGNKDRVLGYGDSTSIDSGDEKLVSLQSRLKQLCQELDCQRHNFEASKNTLEMKYKESESTLKADLKYQIQANTDLDKELKESRNKYQQEITQTTKQLDMLTLQLKKSEEAKVACERDLKSLKSEISMNESKLRLKEEELQELQKSKNACEATQQSLQSKIRELEKNCRALTEENSSLSENVKATRMQLEGSNNLVKEKEISLYNVQQELTNLQLRMKELGNNFTTQEVRLNESQMKETLIAEQLEFLVQEKKELNDSLNSEIKRSQNVESSIEEQKQSILLLKEELNKKALNIDELKDQMVNLNNEYQVKVCDLENKFHTAKEEHGALQNVLLESTSIQASLKGKIEQLKESNKELSDNISVEKDRNDSLNLNLEEENQKVLSLAEELVSTCLKLEELQNQMNISRNWFENELQEVNATLKSTKEKIAYFESELSASSSNENNLNEKIELMEQEKSELNNKVQQLEVCITKEKLDSALLKEKLDSKCIEFGDLMKVLKEEHVTNKHKLEQELCEVSLKEASLIAKIEQTEGLNKELSDNISVEKNRNECLKLSLEQETGKMLSLKEELASKCMKLEVLQNEMKISRNQFENEIQELKDSSQAKQTSLENELNTFSLNANNMKEKLDLSEQEKLELCNQLKLKVSQVEQLEFCIIKGKEETSVLKEKLDIKCEEFDDFTNQIKILKDEHETNKHKLEQELCEVSLKEASLIDKIEQTEGLNKELSDNISVEKNRNECLKLSLEQETGKILSLKEELASKCMELEELQNEMKISRNQFENEIQELNDSWNSSQAKLTSLENELNIFSLNANNMIEKLDLSEQEKLELCNQLKLKVSQVEQLEFCIIKGKEETSVLKEKLGIKCEEFDDFTNQIKILKDEHESEIEELISTLNSSQAKLASLEAELSTPSLNENNLKEKLVSIEQEKLELWNHLNMKTSEVQQLELFIKKGNDDCSLLKEKLESKCTELDNLKNQVKVLKECEANRSELKQKFHAAIEHLGKLQNQLQESSLMEVSSKEKIKQLEESNAKLSGNLSVENDRTKCLQLNLHEEARKMLSLKEELSSKSLELKELKNEIVLLKNQFESDIQALEAQLDAATSNENAFEEKLKSAEQEKSELSEQLELATLKVQELKSGLENERQTSCLLKEKLASYCVQLEELSNHMKNLSTMYEAKVHELQEKFSSVEVKSMLLESQFKEYSLNKISEEKIDIAEKEKKELLNQLMSANTKIRKLELSIEEEKQDCSMLREELAHYCVGFEKLNNQIKNLNEMHEGKVLELETKFSSVESKSMVLETRLKELSSNKMSEKENIDIIENEERDLLNQVASATIKIQELEEYIEKEKQVYSLLKEDLKNKCVEVEDLNNKMKVLKDEHKLIMHELLEKLQVSEKELGTSQKQLADRSLIEISLKEKIEQLESLNKDLTDNFSAERDRNGCLQQNLQEETQKMLSLKEELSSKSFELGELTNQMLVSKNQFEKEIQTLEAALSSSNIRITSLETEMKTESSNDDTIKEKLERVMQENFELSLQLKPESGKVQQLESSIEAEKETCSLLQEKLENKCLEVEDLYKQMKEDEANVQQFREKLHAAKEVSSMFQNELQDSSTMEVFLKEEIKRLEESNKELSDNLSTESNRNECLQLNLQEEARKISSLKEKLSSKSLELEELTIQMLNSKKQYEVAILEIENQLSSSESGKISLESQVQEHASKLMSLKHEKDELAVCLITERDKGQSLELSLENWRAFVISLDESLSSVESEERALVKEISISKKFYEDKVEKLEIELSLAQLGYTTLKSEREGSTLNEMELKQQLDILIKEKDNLTSEVTKVSSKYMQFEVTTQEQQIKMQELEEKLSYLETHSAALALKLKESCQIEVSLKEDLSQVKNESVKLAGFLGEKTEEVETLNSCIENIKKELSSMEEKLSLKSDKLRDLCVKEEEAIKEYENKIQDLESRLLAAQTIEIDFQNQLQVYALKDDSLTASVAVLEKENIEVTEKLQIENGRREELQLFAQHLADSCASFEEELSNKVSLLEEANTLTNEFQNKIQDLEGRLFSCQTDYQNHLQDCSMNGKNLKSSLTVLEKDNVEMSEKLTAELLKTEKLDLLVEKLTEQLEEFNRQKITLLKESQRTIQNLHDGISDVQSINVILRNEVKCHLLNEQILKKTVDSIVKEKQIIHNQLSVEASKIRILETGIGELKRMIMALQVMLLCNNDDTNWAHRKKSASKELYKDHGYQRNVHSPDKFNLKSTTPKKSAFSLDSMPVRNLAMASKRVDFEEMASIQSCKEIEYSQALHKLSLHFLEEINSLEQGLIAKVEMLKFLDCYKLFEKKELSCLWKKFLHLTKRLQMIQFLKKFMSFVCNILKSNIVSCKLDNGIKKLSSLLSEKPHLSTQDIFYLCGDTLNKVLFSVSQTLQQSKMVIKQCSINKYSTVHSNLLSVVTSTKFFIYLHHLSRSYINSELGSFKQDPCIKMNVQNVQKVLGVLKVQDMPYFMNYAVALTEYIEKICSGTNILQVHPPSTNFSTSPVPHIFKHYHFNCLDTDNDRILDELCYWKKHCSIFGISECDIEKMIPLFECKSKNDIPSKTTNDMSIEINSLREECCALQNAVLAEKQKQLLLNATIEEIEQDLGETFQQKEKYMMMVLETSKVLVQLKENIGTANAFLMIKLENEFSYDSCFCEMCIQQVESEGNSSHENLTLTNLIECIEKLVELGNQVETKLLEFKQQETELASMYKDLQDRNSELEMTVASLNVGSKDTHDEIESLKYELLKEKENYQRICQTTDQKDSLILELESTNSDLSIVNEQYKVKLGSSEEKIFKLNGGLEELSAVLSSNEGEIKALKKAMEKEALMFENAQLQCKEYESKIQLLNSTISKFEEEKALDKHLNCLTDSKSQKTISELQDKIESLKKANDSLNLTIETIEEELRTVYSEKQNVEEFEKLTQQNIQLKDEVANATQKFVCEQQANKELLSKLETYEKLNVTSNNTVNDLRRKNEILDKDVSLLKGVLRDHEQVILKNNSSLKLKDQVIDRLNLKISEIEQENLDLNMQLEDNVNTASPLKLQLNKLTEQCCIFEEEIKRFKLVEVEKVMLLENVNEMELERDSLIKDANSLQMELEKVSEQLAHHEMAHEQLTLKNKETCEDLNKEVAIRNSLEKELSNKQNEITDLNDQFQKLKTTTERFRLLNSKQEEQNKVLSQKCEDLKKTMEEARNSLEESCRQARKHDKDELVVELKETRSRTITDASDFHILKSVFTNSIHFIVNILDVTILAIKSDSSYPERQTLKSSLLSALQYWKQCSETVPKTENKFNEMFDNLRSFYETLATKQDEELANRSQVESIIYTLNSIGQFCEAGAQKYQTSNDADITNMSIFETTTVGNLAGVNVLPSSLVTELQQIKKLLDEYFSSMKNTINKQAEEMEMFKVKLNEISVNVSSSAESDEKVQSSYKWKYNLIKLNNQKLERDYNKLGKTYHEMEDRVQNLEKEKKSLEEEADELASDFKKIEEQLYNSNELAEALTNLVRTQQKLKDSENENNWLKQKLEYCRSNHGKKAVLRPSEGASNVLAKAEYKENVLKNGSDKFIS